MRSRVVLLTRLRSALGLSGEHDGLAVADIRYPDAVETAIAAVHGAGDLPLITCSVDDVEDVRTMATYAKVRYPGLRTCLEPLPGGPLAVSVIASLVDDIDAEDDGLAWRLSAIDYLRRGTWSATWLPGVAGLRQPSPSLAQHVASWMPGSGFLVEHHPQPRIVRATKAPFTGLSPLQDSALLHSAAARDAWVVDATRQALQPRSTSEVSSVRDQVDAHGTDRAVELVAIPSDYHVASRPDPDSIVDCPGCSARHARPACPVCAMVAPSRTPEPAHAAAAPQGDPQ